MFELSEFLFEQEKLTGHFELSMYNNSVYYKGVRLRKTSIASSQW